MTQQKYEGSSFGGFLDAYERPYERPYERHMQPISQPPQPSLAEEVAKLREQIEELVYWVRPMNGDLITGKHAVDEYEALIRKRSGSNLG